MTENGFVRVVSSPAYPGRRTTVADAVERLRRFAGSGNHTRWSDDISILDEGGIYASHLAGHREVTDAYLLALAVHHQGALATFDRSIRTEAAPGFGAPNLTVLPADV
jgi:predicted nucleic acid-binding protein